MVEMIKKCLSLTPDALERLTVTRHANFSVFPGHPLMLEMIRKCPSLTSDALERSR